ncbi:hypothetical protein PBI_BRIDGETTE_53 [Arthrobacter phage Bridgette]|uniref:DUF2303 family protein n=1 Tax=Arthrobacter phage Bridgette TaxID=2419949 RepID=A0A3G2KEB2_9CAUD|nr:hypothetical protein HOU46_gp53 [Arthrobacter phage Bridgette]AYN57319.1 hypothetical protein PBI_BRIDGETTE_53 [Arthrobacter phage Bridgette]
MAPNYDPITTLTAPDTEAATVASLGRQTAAPTELKAGTVYLIADGKDGVKVIDTDSYAPNPRSKTGSKVVADFGSFQQYLDKHGLEAETEVTASVSNGTFAAVLDAGDEHKAGWGGHTATLKLSKSPEWQRWADRSGKLSNQADFAEFIEDNAKDIVEPSSAGILEIAQSLQVKRGVEFESGTRLSDGNVQFGYRESTTATAGSVGQLVIPEKITLALRPFKGEDPYRVTALFRYRLQGSQLTLGFKLQEPEKVIEDAFDNVAEQVREYAAQRDFLYLNAG